MRRPAGRAGRAARPTPSTASAPTPSTRTPSSALLEAKGRGREMPPPVLVSAATTLDALADRRARLRPGPGRGVLARPADPRLQPADLAPVGPRRHPRHGRRADARPRGRARAARAHRPAGRQLGQPHRPARRHRRRRRPRRCSASGSTSSSTAGDSPGGEASTIVDVTGLAGPGAAPGRALARGAQRRRSTARRDADATRTRGAERPCVSTSSSSWSPRRSPTC